MAFGAPTVWECRSTGNDGNGGGFDPVSGTPGTDYSQQDSPQITYTDLVIDAVSNTKCTSAGNPFTGAHVGNIINVTSGTGFTVQRVQVLSVAAAVATVDKSLGTLGSTGGNGKLGGALATPATAVPLMVGGNDTHVKNGTYLQTATLTPPAGTAGDPTRIIGYNVTRGDLTGATTFANHPVLQNNNVTSNVLTLSNDYIYALNLVLSGGTAASKAARGVTCGGSYLVIANCKAMNCTDYGIIANGSYQLVLACHVTGMVAAATTSFYGGTQAHFYGCVALSNPCTGFLAQQECSFTNCIAAGMTGANGHGFLVSVINVGVMGCVAYGNSQDGIHIDTSQAKSFRAQNNILSQNSGYGINNADTWVQMPLVNFNAFYSNTSGARTGVPTGPNDVTLTADPFTAASSADFTLNNTAGGGAACRAAGFPGTIPAVTGTGYMDIGAFQVRAGGARLVGAGGLAG